MISYQKNRAYLFFAFVVSFPFVCFLASVLCQSIFFPLFPSSYATVLLDREGRMLGASIAEDEQWRFEPLQQVPEKLKQAILIFEDKRFYSHNGVDFFSILRAARSNFSRGKIVSGASTITMQVARLARKRTGRHWGDKITEMFWAWKLELLYSKEEILRFYTANAPYGGNIVGVEAASWRYFGRPPEGLSWGEAAFLAVLPNNPSGFIKALQRDAGFSTKRGAEKRLLERRNSLLKLLLEEGKITSQDYHLASQEPIPEKIIAFPLLSPHLMTRTIKDGRRGKTWKTTMDSFLQQRTTATLERHFRFFSQSNVHNAACLILDIESGDALAYVGNTGGWNNREQGSAVDVITSLRSPGSVLKPLLYCLMIQEGRLYPDELIPDIPIFYQGFAPKNFNSTYEGAVPASEALARSLNVPFVFLLQEYGLQKFYDQSVMMGLNWKESASHYGLSLILGSAEVTMWQLTAVYASLARSLNHYLRTGVSARTDYHANRYLEGEKAAGFSGNFIGNPAAIYETFQAMKEVVRPLEEQSWQKYTSARPIAWKSGTSFGNRDAWALGLNKDHLVCVWVGNADGEGRPEITGVNLAAPILFDVFPLLSMRKNQTDGGSNGWFEVPKAEMETVTICKKSGMLSGENCERVEERVLPKTLALRGGCRYCHLVHLDESMTYQVRGDAFPVYKMKHRSYFTLPPVQEWYYKRRHSDYEVLPRFREDQTSCRMEFIYPKEDARIRIPIMLDGTLGETVFELAHRQPDTTVYWHIDGVYYGKTQRFHQLSFSLESGRHEVVVIDENGEELSRSFEVIRGNP